MMKHMLSTVLVAASALAGMSTLEPALAGSNVFVNQTSCTTTNCGASVINGTYQFDAANANADPFVLQVFSGGNECVRIDVLSQSTDLEAVLISPNGTIYRNDDRGGSVNGLFPLIEADVSPRGWYTLQLARFDGRAPRGDFTFAYGRFNSGNPNCAAPTVPTFAAMSHLAKPSATNAGPTPSGGTSLR